MIDPGAHLAIRDLERRLRPFLARRLSRPSDVDDAVQEVLLRVQRGAGSIRDEDRFGPWVYRIARNVLIDRARSGARAMSPEVIDLDALSAPDDEDCVEREFATYVAPFVAMLDSPYREALTLTELEGLTQREAAEMLGISISGMKSRVQRGRLRLREALEDCCRIVTDVHGRVIEFERRPDGMPRDACCGGDTGCRGGG